MPYNSTSELPSRVRDNVPSERGRRMFMEVVNSALDEGKSESVAFSAAWAALSNAGFEQNSEGNWVRKRQINDDIFTREDEAQARSQDLGFGGEIHTHETADGQRVYMPGSSHDEYLGRVSELESEYSSGQTNSNLLSMLVHSIVDALTGNRYRREEIDSGMDEDKMTGRILKADDEQRVVYGWASVVTEKGEPVVDKQGDMISPEAMEKMATDFMLSARMAKAMHEGDGIGEVVHSMPMTREIAKVFNVETDREGWMIAMKIHDEDVWERVKSGELRAISIGGEAVSEDA